MPIKNAIIESASLSVDESFLDARVGLDYGGSTQQFGGYVLYLPRSSSNHELKSVAGHFIFRVLEVAGATRWEDLKGRPVRVDMAPEGIRAIGHIIKDDWFSPLDDFSIDKYTPAPPPDPLILDQAMTDIVNDFLKWPLPESVCADGCATERGYPHRSGTNLLTFTEAATMVRDVVKPAVDRILAAKVAKYVEVLQVIRQEYYRKHLPEHPIIDRVIDLIHE